MGEGSVSCSLALPSIPLSSLLAYFMQHGRLHSTVAGEGDSSPAPCAPRLRRGAPHTVRQGGGEWRRGGVHASPIRQQPALARGISHRSRRSMATTTLQKGNEKKTLYRKTNRVTLIGYSSLKYSEWIYFIHYFILYLQLLLLIEQAIIESWLVNLITYHLGNSSQLHTLFLCRF